MNTHSTNRSTRPTRPTLTPAAMFAKSAVGVALVAGLAWIGAASLGSGNATDPSAQAAGTAAGVAFRGDHAAAHRREVFEERRARFESREGTQIAGSLSEHPAP